MPISEQREGQGLLFREREKRSPKAPDFRGAICVNGQQLRLVAWIKKAKNGSSFLSLSIDERPLAPERPDQQPSSEADDEVPF